VSKPKYAIKLLRAAEEDFTEIVTYIAAENPSAAEKMATKIEKNISLLSHNPYLGRIPEDEELVRLGYRFLVVQNYLIFYTLEEHTIFIYCIIHGARDYLRIL
jgi:toxin ParE1/3/4